jgi:hypothetical protein
VLGRTFLKRSKKSNLKPNEEGDEGEEDGVSEGNENTDSDDKNQNDGDEKLGEIITLDKEKALKEIKFHVRNIEEIHDGIFASVSSQLDDYHAIGKIAYENREILTQKEIADEVGWKQQRVSEAFRFFKRYSNGLDDEVRKKSVKWVMRFMLPEGTRIDARSQNKKNESANATTDKSENQTFGFKSIALKLRLVDFELLEQVAQKQTTSPEELAHRIMMKELEKIRLGF